MRWMVEICHWASWVLNSYWIACSSVCSSRVITGLARKMRYWLTYFWALCFTPSPHHLLFLHSSPFLQPKFSVPFIFFFSISASLPTGPLRVEVRSEATWLLHVAEHEQPGNKGLPLFKLSPSPPPPASLWRKPLQGCVNGGLWVSVPSRQWSFRCCHEASHTEISWVRKKGGKKREVTHLCFGSRTKRRRRNLYVLHLFGIIRWWAASFGCQELFSERAWMPLERLLFPHVKAE